MIYRFLFAVSLVVITPLFSVLAQYYRCEWQVVAIRDVIVMAPHFLSA